MADWIPGINVGNAFRQVGSLVGLAPKGDYDVLDNYTNSNRAGQRQVNALPDVTSGNKVIGTQPRATGGTAARQPASTPTSTYVAPQATYNPGVTYNGVIS